MEIFYNHHLYICKRKDKKERWNEEINKLQKQKSKPNKKNFKNVTRKLELKCLKGNEIDKIWVDR